MNNNCALATWPSGLGIGDKGWEGEPVFAERILCVKPPETVHTVGLATDLKKTCDQKNLTRDTHNVDLREKHAFWGQCLRQARHVATDKAGLIIGGQSKLERKGKHWTQLSQMGFLNAQILQVISNLWVGGIDVETIALVDRGTHLRT